MRITRTRNYSIKSEINITPFTDVVLVLLIIFMIATPIIIQSSITVNLPKSKYGEESSTEQFEVIIKSDKEFYFNNRSIDLNSLKQQLAAHAAKHQAEDDHQRAVHLESHLQADDQNGKSQPLKNDTSHAVGNPAVKGQTQKAACDDGQRIGQCSQGKMHGRQGLTGCARAGKAFREGPGMQ